MKQLTILLNPVHTNACTKPILTHLRGDLASDRDAPEASPSRNLLPLSCHNHSFGEPRTLLLFVIVYLAKFYLQMRLHYRVPRLTLYMGLARTHRGEVSESILGTYPAS